MQSTETNFQTKKEWTKRFLLIPVQFFLAKKVVFKLGIVFVLFSILTSCASSQKWETAWPNYSKQESREQSIALVGRGDVFTLMRAKWFSNRLEISADSVYPFFENFADSLIVSTLKTSYPNLYVFPKKFRSKFPEETQKLDERIFIKGRFPEQGKSVPSENGDIPNFLILIHEITLGTDLDKISFFDYSQKQNEIGEKKVPQNMSLIMSFTLWDNIRQIPVYSSILDFHTNASQNTSLQNISEFLKNSFAIIPQKINQGVKK